MQFQALVLAAMAAVVSAQQTTVPDSVKSSVLNVLITALPSTALQAAATNQASFIADIASSVEAGQTPDWYKALPSDVKTLLTEIYPVAAVTTTASGSVSASGSGSSIPALVTSAPVTASTGALTSSGSNSTSITSVNSPTLSSSGRTSSLSSATSSSSTSAPTSNGAAVPNAAIGSGIVGAFGVLGLLLL